MDVRPGYKQTEVGIIPQEWEVYTLSELTTQIIDGTHFTPRYTTFGVPFLRVTDIQHSEIDFADLKFISSAEHALLTRRCLPRKGDLLLSKNGTIGIPKVVSWDWEFSIFVSLALLKLRTELISASFLEQFFRSDFLARQIRQRSKQGTVTNLHLEEIREFHIPLPPTKDEQDAIATALSDVDALLGGLDRLIAKKRDLKQAAMQQLLTGQTRLPDFHGEWEVKHLGDVGPFLKGSGIRKDEARSGDLPCVRYGEIYTHHHDYIRSFNSWISPKVAATATRLKRGDLLFAGSGETKEEIRKCVAFIDGREAYAGGDIVILRPADADPMFMGYYCNTPPINAQKASKGQGDAVVHISAAALSGIVLKLPDVPEQTAIAAVLSDMDAELAALETRRDKTRDLKQAMMQELLTGKTRLVTPDNNERKP